MGNIQLSKHPLKIDIIICLSIGQLCKQFSFFSTWEIHIKLLMKKKSLLKMIMYDDSALTVYRFRELFPKNMHKLYILDSGQWSVVSGQWSVVSGQWTVVSGQWTVVSGQWSVDSGQWIVDSGQWSVDSGQWSVVSGQWSVDSGQWTVVSDK